MELTLASLADKRVHLLGIGGIGVSALARMLAAHGIAVTGCDVRESTLTRALREEGIEVAIGHDPAHLANNDVVVYSTAVPADNKELAAARESTDVLCLHRSELLALLVAAHETVGVTGTNGKGTVCTMITWLLQQAGLEPSFYIGGLSPNLGTNARETRGRYMVAELDESDGSLCNIRPSLALINNLELDHLNYYESFDQVVETLARFVHQLPAGAPLFVNADDEGAMQVAARAGDRRVVTFGAAPTAHYRYRVCSLGDRKSCFEVTRGDESWGEFELNVPGEYNIENAIGAIAVASELGLAPETVRRALPGFRGLANRYTVLHGGERKCVKDYMSHPSGMRKVLRTARLGEPRRLVAVFKPYRYTMIRYHARNYAEALAAADEIIITDMWEANEEPIPGVDTSWLVEQLRSAGLNVIHIPDMEPIRDHLLATTKAGDCVVFFGGNDLFAIAEETCDGFTRQAQAAPDGIDSEVPS